ncbi:autotransporter domain-containing protein [Xenorhabdus sp. PB61.4]|uniref:autotransporter outer membrane beta-barrel domain-containing protein n=1 Tax=Xenorhabdus sp. PB61.4 TaxID=2788940 RepID=UPI001E4DFAAE|nr:autotransporter domain-containing protein [Xenorhabdus sp. PB61.4]
MKKAFLFAPALLALSVSTIANAQSYNILCTNGNSLSDSGNNGVYTSDQKEVYSQYVSRVSLNQDHFSSKHGGTNLAVGGATAISKLNPKNPDNTTDNQLKDVLRNNNCVDPNAIFIHWIGGNDIAQTLQNTLGDPNKAYSELIESAEAAAGQINQLVDAGVGLIIAPTIPDVGMAPRVLDEVLTMGLEKELKNKGISEDKIKVIIKGTLGKVHSDINDADLPNGEARHLALQKVFDSLAQKASKDFNLDAEKVKKNLTEGYSKASMLATKYTKDYNKIVDDKISANNGNILRADIYGLLHEVIDNPFSYGFNNNLGYSCAVGKSSRYCKSEDADFDKRKEFIFSDNFHPSPLAHKIMGQYIVSTLIAPSQVMTLNQVNRTPVKGTRASLDGHLQQLRHTGNEQGKFGVFGSYTDNRHDSFTLGSDYQLAENFLLGALYSNNKFDRSSVSNFTYEGNGHVATGYALWNLFDNAWLSGDIHYARINYDSLTRNIQLGQANRKETGSTTGKEWGARLTANWDIPVTDIVTTSPIVQFSWDKGDVKGYRESGNNSSAMRFSDQNYTSKVGTLGWRVDTQLGRFNPYASIQFNHQFGDTQYKLRSAMNKSDKLSFVTDSSKQGKDWRQYTIGANANLFGNIHGFASVTRNEGSSQDPNYNFSLGVSSRF